MKVYLTIVIPLVVLVLVLAGSYFLLPTIESPQASLDRQIDEKVELAQRMLYQYNPASPIEQRAFEPTTQPESVDPDKWRAYQDFDENTPFASLRDHVLMRQQEFSAMGDSQAPPPMVPQAEEAYRRVLDELKGGQALLDKAIATVREAINLQAGSGEAEVSGRNNPAATRLEAILLYHKADLLRREAALVRAKANLDRQQVEHVAELSREIQDQVAAQKVLLAGGTTPAMPVRAAVAAPSAKTSGDVAKSGDAAKKPAVDAGQADKPAGSAKPSGVLGLLGQLADRVLKKPQPSAGQQEQTTAEPADTEAATAQPAAEKPAATEPAQSEPSEALAEAPAETQPGEQIPSLPERIAALRKTRGEVEAQIGQGQAEVERLQKEIEQLTARRDAAATQAKQAELKMLAAEQKGADAGNPESVQAFVNEYRKLSEVQRQAAREAATLEQGSVRNARSAADPEDILSSPLSAAEESKPLQTERGLVAIENDKAVAEAAVAASKGLLAEIDLQIAELADREKNVEARLADLQQRGEELRGRMSLHAASAAREVAHADLLENEAIDIAQGSGLQAAQQAQSAAGEYQRRVADFIRSENPTEVPERKLTEMAADQFGVANAVVLQGDLYYLVARTLVQQAGDLKLHERMLRNLAAFSVEVKLDAQQLPEGVTAETLPANAVSADAAVEAVVEDMKKAAEAGKLALEQYAQAASQSKDLWAVHANMAAVHNLLADLPRTEGDEDHLALARDTYTRAIQGREKLPEYAAYRRIIEGLKTSPKEQ